MALAPAYKPSVAWTPPLWSWRRPEWWPRRGAPGDLLLAPPVDAYPWDLRRGLLVLAEL